jgi:hypothetical protein
MAITTINIGAVVNDGTGDPIRSAFDKVNTDLLYLDAGSTFNTKLINSNVFGGTSTLTVNNAVVSRTITGNIITARHVTIANILTVSNATQSTSTSTGAVVVAGGVGVGGNLNVSGNIIASAIYGTIIGSISTPDIDNTRLGKNIPAEAGFTNVTMSGNLSITDTTATTSDTTGALKVVGGISTQNNVHVGGNAVVGNLTVSNTVRGSLFLTGSDTVYINGAAVQTTSTSFPGGNVALQANFNATTSSIDAGTGAVIIKGGLGVQGNINVGGFIGGGNLNLNTVAGHLELGNVDLYANGAIFGNLRTGAQPGITSVGSLSGLTISGNLVAGLSNQYWIGDETVPFLRMYSSRFYGDFYGPVSTPAQTLITSLGTLTGLTVEGTAILGDISSNVVIVSTVPSTTHNTGALVVKGGVGIDGNVILTGNLVVAGVDLTSNISSSGAAIQTIQANIGAYQIFANANAATQSASLTTLTANAAVQSADIVVLQTNAATQATSINTITTNTGLFYTYANTKIGTNTNSNLVVVASTASTNNTTGALVVTGGVGIAGTINVGTVGIGNAIVATGNLSIAGNILPFSGNALYSIGSSTAWFNAFYGRSVQAQYADLAEIYVGDDDYPAGTVVIIGGDAEVTVTTIDHDTRVAGVVSTDPAYLMNSTSAGVPVALTGRVPCRVQGPVSKGALLVTADIAGVAQQLDPAKYQPGCVIGKSLTEIKDNDIHVIEIMVGRF